MLTSAIVPSRPFQGTANKIAAKTDAIICDPNYTGTVMAALIDQIRKNNINENETVIFIHTGGLPALFTFSEELSAFSF